MGCFKSIDLHWLFDFYFFVCVVFGCFIFALVQALVFSNVKL